MSVLFISVEGNSSAIALWWRLVDDTSVFIIGHEQRSTPRIDLWQRSAQGKLLR